MPRLYVEEIHLQILKNLLEGQGHVGTFSGDGGTGRHHFGSLPLWCWHRGHSQTPQPPSALLMLVGVLCPQHFPLPHQSCGQYSPLRDAPCSLALVARRVYVPGPHGAVTMGKMVLGRLPFLGHCTDSWLKRTLVCQRKRLIYKFWSCNLRDRLQVCCTSWGYQSTLGTHTER